MLQLHQVLPNLFVSNRPALYDAPTLQRAGITNIINTTIRPDPHWPINTLNDGTPDDGQHKSVAWFAKGITYALRAMHSGGKVLVHCESGVHRSPSMAYAILRARGVDPAGAQMLIHLKIPNAFLRYQADAESAVRELRYDGVSHADSGTVWTNE